MLRGHIRYPGVESGHCAIVNDKDVLNGLIENDFSG